MTRLHTVMNQRRSHGTDQKPSTATGRVHRIGSAASWLAANVRVGGHPHLMDILRMLTAECGFFTRPDAHGAGYGDRDLTRGIRDKTLVRFRRGGYAFTDEWNQWDTVIQHRVRCRAVMRSLGGNVALSHVSGALVHGIDWWGMPLDKVHVTRLDGGPGRTEGDVVHHEGLALDDDVVSVNELSTLRAERCVLEAASRSTNEAAFCLFESGLRGGAFTQEQLLRQHELLQWWPYMRHLHIPVRMADHLSGSIGESRGKWMFWTFGLPAPISQYEVRHPNGELAGICDWCWPERGVLGEFDGRVKYGRLLRPGQEPGDVVFAEKRREDVIRELTDCRMVRLIWDDYRTPERTRVRLEQFLQRTG